MIIHPFDVREFVKENKRLVKKYIRKNTYKVFIDDLILDNSYYYQKNEQLLNKKEKPEYSTMQKLEYIKCMRDCSYFTQKYIKIISIDDGVIPFNLYDYQHELLNKYQNNRFIITLQARQTGKMIDLDTPIMTHNGFVRNGDLKVGDTIYGRNGLPTKITFISEQRNDMNQYELTFDNGQKIKACGEHLWAFKSSDKRKDEYVQNTEYMLKEFDKVKSRSNPGSVWIDITKPLQFESKPVSIDPYTLGLWLGDGDTESNLLNNKHIPEDYIYNDEITRIELIRGLMDSGGYCAKNGSCEFYQKDKSLIDCVRLILSTLGIKSRVREEFVDGYSGSEYTLSFCVSVDKFEVFKSPIKLQRQNNCKSHPNNERIYLSSYKKLNDDEKVYMQCLTVEDDDHMFLCGETLVPTHNTQTTAAYILWFNTFHDSKESAILANKLAQAQEIMERVQMSYENLPNFLKQGVSEYNKRSMKFSNYSKIFCATSTSSSIRGKSISLLYIDECAFLRDDMTFYESTYPVITSGKDSQVIVSSTPNGARGLFYKLFSESVEGINKYVNHKVTWDMVPGRDQEWKEEQIANTSREQFDQEHNCITGESIIELKDDHIKAFMPIEELYILSTQFNSTLNSGDDKYIDRESIKDLCMNKKGVVYRIIREDMLSYIGTTVDLKRRIWQHSRTPKFSDKRILDFEVLYEGDYYDCLRMEEHYIQKYDTFRNGLNMTEHGRGENHSTKFNTYGRKHSEETKRKIGQKSKLSKKHKGPKHSGKQKQKWSDMRKGVVPKHAVKVDKQYILDEYDNFNYSLGQLVDKLKKSQKDEYIHNGKVSDEPKFKNGYSVNKFRAFSIIYSEKLDVTPNCIKRILKESGIHDSN
ncbi:MAG: terminase family protein [Nitrosopumilaceae archaeon]|nr:terminase family protein [Nitrosopumilaceae archaeon]